MNNFTDWLMCILTGIYVVATILIFLSNKKSADAASLQIEESKNIQKQNAALQLFNQRTNIYDILSEWITNAKIICRDDMHFNQSLPLFHSMIFNNAKDIELRDLRYQVFQIEQNLGRYGVLEQTEEIEILHEQLQVLSRELLLRKLSMIGKETKILELSEICFKANYEIIKDFVDAYVELTLNYDQEIKKDSVYFYTNQLKNATRKLLDEKILEKMKEDMKEINSFT